MSQDCLNTAMNLIYLVSCAVNEEKPDKKICDKINLTSLYGLAVRHSLSAAAAIALEKVMVLPENFKEAKYKAVRRLSLLNVKRQSMLNEFEKKQIWYLPLKGIVLKEYYPKTAMREMSDNDILCDESKMPEVKAVMEDLGYKCTRYGKENHDVYEKPVKLDFEMHHSLFDSQDEPEFYSYFRDIKGKLIKDSGNGYGFHMTNEDMYIYLICHLYKHYNTMGTGIRSILDIYVYNKIFNDKLDRAYLDTEFKKLDLTAFEKGISEFSYKLFTGQELSEEEIGELRFFVESNSHGTKDIILSRKLDNDDSISAKSKYIMHRLFPSENYYKRNKPAIYRHKILYPFWVVCRPVKGAITHPKKMLGEFKRITRFKKKDNKGIYRK